MKYALNDHSRVIKGKGSALCYISIQRQLHSVPSLAKANATVTTERDARDLRVQNDLIDPHHRLVLGCARRASTRGSASRLDVGVLLRKILHLQAGRLRAHREQVKM